MATIHIVKDGKRPNGERITSSIEAPTSLLAEKFKHVQLRHSVAPPTINPSVTASDWGAYKHVVVQIPPGETMAPFSEPGYYYLVAVSPADCARTLGISFPDI